MVWADVAQVWSEIIAFFVGHGWSLGSFAELVKIFGAFASFYAIVKLKSIEKKYLFRATLSASIKNLETALGALNTALNDIDSSGIQIREALNHLVADAKGIKKKSGKDSGIAVDNLLAAIERTGVIRGFWKFKVVSRIDKEVLLDIYGKGSGLIRTLQNEGSERNWEGK